MVSTFPQYPFVLPTQTFTPHTATEKPIGNQVPDDDRVPEITPSPDLSSLSLECPNSTTTTPTTKFSYLWPDMLHPSNMAAFAPSIPPYMSKTATSDNTLRYDSHIPFHCLFPSSTLGNLSVPLSRPYKPDTVFDGAVAKSTFSDDMKNESETRLKNGYKNPFIVEGSKAPFCWKEGSEEGDALYVRIDMPGVSKKGVNLWLEEDMTVLNIEGEETKKEAEEYNKEDECDLRKYSAHIKLSPGKYKVDEIRASMDDGVLRVVVPRMKIEEKKGALVVKVN